MAGPEDFRKLDARLQEMRRQHPWRFAILSLAIAVGISSAAFVMVMFLKWFFEVANKANR